MACVTLPKIKCCFRNIVSAGSFRCSHPMFLMDVVRAYFSMLVYTSCPGQNPLAFNCIGVCLTKNAELTILGVVNSAFMLQARWSYKKYRQITSFLGDNRPWPRFGVNQLRHISLLNDDEAEFNH